jgi:hypothetical protein
MTAPDFDWYGNDAEDIVIPEQQAVAVYRNHAGDVVIRQKAGDYWNQVDEDPWIVVKREHVGRLALALLALAELEQAPRLALPAPAADRTAAERQRRYRERKRNRQIVTASVTAADRNAPELFEEVPAS